MDKETHEDTTRIETLESELEEERALLQRVQADFDNYRKRTEKMHTQLIEEAKIPLLKELLTIMDSIEAGILAEQDKESGSFRGLLLIHEELRKLFEKNGVHEIEALGKPFDAAYHEALLQREGEEPGIICEVLQKGYTYNTRILRHTKVIVGK